MGHGKGNAAIVFVGDAPAAPQGSQLGTGSANSSSKGNDIPPVSEQPLMESSGTTGAVLAGAAGAPAPALAVAAAPAAVAPAPVREVQHRQQQQQRERQQQQREQQQQEQHLTLAVAGTMIPSSKKVQERQIFTCI